jgi:hypothetical protein
MICELFDYSGCYFKQQPLISYLVAEEMSRTMQRPCNNESIRQETIQNLADFFDPGTKSDYIKPERFAFFSDQTQFWDAVLSDNPGIDQVFTHDSMMIDHYKPFIKQNIRVDNGRLKMFGINEAGNTTYSEVEAFLRKADSEKDLVAWSVTSHTTGANVHPQRPLGFSGAYDLNVVYNNLSINTINHYLLVNANNQMNGPNVWIGISPYRNPWKKTHTVSSENLQGINAGIELSKYQPFDVGRPAGEIFNFKIKNTHLVHSVGFGHMYTSNSCLIRFDNADAQCVARYLLEQEIYCDIVLPEESPWSQKWLKKPALRFTTHIHTTQKDIAELERVLKNYGDKYGL